MQHASPGPGTRGNTATSRTGGIGQLGHSRGPLSRAHVQRDRRGGRREPEHDLPTRPWWREGRPGNAASARGPRACRGGEGSAKARYGLAHNDGEPPEGGSPDRLAALGVHHDRRVVECWRSHRPTRTPPSPEREVDEDDDGGSASVEDGDAATCQNGAASTSAGGRCSPQDGTAAPAGGAVRRVAAFAWAP